MHYSLVWYALFCVKRLVVRIYFRVVSHVNLLGELRCLYTSIMLVYLVENKVLMTRELVVSGEK